MNASTARKFTIAAAVVVAATACSSTGDDSIGGDGLPVQNPAESYGHDNGSLEGQVTLQPNGCWTIDLGDGNRLLVFPEGYSKDATGLLMVSPDGATDVGDTDQVVATGGVVPATTFPGVPDGFWGNYLAFCQPQIDDFVVVDEVLSSS